MIRNTLSKLNFYRKFLTQNSRAAKRFWLWAIGGGLSCYTIVLTTIVIPNAQIDNATSQQQMLQINGNLKQLGRSEYPDQRDRPQIKLATLDRLSVVARDLDTLAAENGLQLTDASYLPVADAINKDIYSMQITAHLKGTYPAVKKTIAGMLATHDGLALESMVIGRAAQTDLISNIELGFIFYYR